MPKVIDNEVQEQFIEMRAKNFPYERIAEELKVSKPTLIKWGKELEMEISNAKALERQAIMERYHVSWNKRVQLLGEKVEVLMSELEKRDLSEVPTEKLLDLLLKYMDKLKGEEVKVELKGETTFEDSIDNLMKNTLEWNA